MSQPQTAEDRQLNKYGTGTCVLASHFCSVPTSAWATHLTRTQSEDVSALRVQSFMSSTTTGLTNSVSQSPTTPVQTRVIAMTITMAADAITAAAGAATITTDAALIATVTVITVTARSNALKVSSTELT